MKHLFSSSPRSIKLLSGSRFFMHLGTFSRSGMWLLLFGLMVHTFSLQAQAPVNQWDTVYGGSEDDQLGKAIQTSDGGYLLGGTSTSGISDDKTEASRGDADYWLVKISSSGEKEWDRTFGGSGEETFSSLIQTSDGGYLLGGSSASGISGEKSEASQGEDYWIVKISGSGEKEWDRTFGGSGPDMLGGLVQLADGGYVLGGDFGSNRRGSKQELWIVKISSSGIKEWDKTFGSDYTEAFADLITTADGGFLVGSVPNVGRSMDDRGGANYAVYKFGADGQIQWSKDNIGGDSSDELARIVQAPDGGYLLAGTSNSYASGDKTESGEPDPHYDGFHWQDFWIVKLNSTGAIEWDKTISGPFDDLASSIALMPDGGFLIGGTSASNSGGDKTEPNRCSCSIDAQVLPDYWLVKVNGMGTVEWDKTIGGTWRDRLSTVLLTADNEYLLTGTSSSHTSADKTAPARGEFNSETRSHNDDYWVVKLGMDAPEKRITSFTLIDADTDRDIQTLNDGDVLDLAKLPTANLNIRANVSPATGGSVVFQLNKKPRHIENHAVYALFGNTADDDADTAGDYNAGLLPMGQNTLKATPYANTYGKGPAGVAHTVQFTVVGFRIRRLVLVNADTDQDVWDPSSYTGGVVELHNGSVIDYRRLDTRNINIRAETYPATVGSVVFRLNSKLIRRENILPYALGGDNYPNVDDYHAYPLPLGKHTLEVTPHAGRNGSGEMGGAIVWDIYVLDWDNYPSASLATTAVDGKGSRFVAFPNPFTDKLTVQMGTEDGPVQATLVDQLGRTVYQKAYPSGAGAVEIDVSGGGLKAGVYTLHLTSATGTKAVKLMKQ